ncbi:MAG: 30S ribosomal protein S16 [Balneolaceae bacterium]|nr:30S ribosomal protein S16 [Balneolaceae bacterium]
MIKIRLQRKGRIRRPIYHIVVADSRSPRDGRIIEQVGRFDGVTEKKETILNEDRIMYWLDTGAQPTDSVRKILRTEGVLYKRHLKMWGKSDEEIEAAMQEWKAYRDSKQGEEVTRRDQVKAALAAEEKEFKKQVETKSAEAAKEVAEEAAAEAEEVAAEETTEEVAEEAVEETSTEETEAVEEVAETTEEAPAEEPVVEEVAEEAPAEEEKKEEEPAAEETKEEVAEEPAEEASEEAAKTSVDMTAKEAADHISNTDLADLEGFVTDAEERKTVLAAWESKKAE